MMIEGQELLSVIIPIYNVEEYLPRCLESVINQTYGNLEIICVDDGSTDGSGVIADKYAKIDSRISVIHKANGGLVSARKAGIQMATGKYISNIDSDDYIEADMYSELMKEIISHDADVITSGLIRDYGNHLIYENESIKPGIYKEDDLKNKILLNMIDIEKFYKPNISMHITNKIFKAEKLKEVQLRIDERINVGEDVAVVIPYFINSQKCIITDRNFYHYCIRNDSIMGIKKKDDNASLNILFEYLNEEIKKVTYENNYSMQILFLQTYLFLLRDVSSVLKIDENGLYPFGKIDRSDSILLYGAGKFGAQLKNFLDENGFKVVAWVDKSKNRDCVVELDEIQNDQFDIVIIATLVSTAIEQIRTTLIKRGIKEENIFSVNKNILKR